MDENVRGISSFNTNGYRPCSRSPLFINKRIGVPRTSLVGCQSTSPKLEASPSEDSIHTIGESAVTSSKQETSIFEKFDLFCLSLKPEALKANEKSQAFTDDKTKKILYAAKSCGLFTLFIIYRAYRGCFCILPAVFREVYRKMEVTVRDPFNEVDYTAATTPDDISPTTGKVRLRTRVVISILTSIVTLSYVITGAFKVFQMFVGTATRTSSVEPAFEAAADEILSNEGRVMKLAGKDKALLNGEDLAP